LAPYFHPTGHQLLLPRARSCPTGENRLTTDGNTIAELNDSLIGRYLVEQEIGQGGMATVYLARDVRHDRKVAIKVIHPELAVVLGPDRFVTEMKVTANLQHPHILPLFDSGTARGQLFYVMPFVEGETLRDKLTREQQLPIDEAVRLTTEVAGALDYAHRHGVVHRDIKPENILLHDGTALVADFGIALAVSNAGGTRLTQTGLSLGTPQYMSPEQATGDKVIDGRTDVYSLGCMMYEMLTGEPPFTGPSSQAIVARVLTEQVRPIRARRDTVSPELEDAVVMALQKLPADRFATPGAFADALRVGGTGRTTAGRAASRHTAATSRQLRSWQLLAGVSLVAAIAALVAGARRSPPSDGLQVARQLTFEGNVIAAALSADGAWLAYVTNNCLGREFSCGRTLQVREVDGTTSVPIAANWYAIAPAVRWSNDGAMLAFAGSREHGATAVHLTDRLGSSKGSIPVATQVFAFTPDGKSIALVTGTLAHEYILRYDVTTLARIDSMPLPAGWDVTDVSYNAGGTRLAATCHCGSAALVALLDTRGAVLDTVSGIYRSTVRWTADNAGVLVFVSGPGTADDLTRIPVSGDHFRAAEQQPVLGQISTGYVGIFDASHTGRIAMVATPMTHQIQVLRLDHASDGWRNLTDRTGFLDPGAISADDSLLVATATDNLGDNTYIFALATGASQPLTTVRGGYQFAQWSPDGRRVAVTRYAGSSLGIVLQSIAGGAERVLVPGDVSGAFAWSGTDAITVSRSSWLVTIDTLGTRIDSLAVPDSLAKETRSLLAADVASRRLSWWSDRADGVVIADLRSKSFAIALRHARTFVPLSLLADGSIIGSTAGDSSAKAPDERKNALRRLGPGGTVLTYLAALPAFCSGAVVSPSGRWAACTIRTTKPDVWLADKAGKSGW
jgi:eukaryotic-like serine/threonine-protein kinase